MAGAVAMVALGVLTPEQVYRDAVNWDTLVLLLGMMVITSVMARASLFRWVSWAALRHAHGPRTLLVVLVLVAGGLSALLVNDTVCVMCTPLVVALIDAAALPPLPYLLGLAFASNAGSVATLTGNPQNMLIGTLSKIHYARFSAAMLLPALLPGGEQRPLRAPGGPLDPQNGRADVGLAITGARFDPGREPDAGGVGRQPDRARTIGR